MAVLQADEVTKEQVGLLMAGVPLEQLQLDPEGVKASAKNVERTL
jgi:hypothetical protein